MHSLNVQHCMPSLNVLHCMQSLNVRRLIHHIIMKIMVITYEVNAQMLIRSFYSLRIE